MIYEFRTYDLKPRSLAEYEKRMAERVPLRLKYSKLGAFWHTEIGPLNQVVHVWLYDDLNQRAEVRAKVAEDKVWPPEANEFIVNMQSDVFMPAPFMRPLGDERKIGPIYEMRTYTYAPGAIPRVIEAWSQRIAEREKLSPLVGAWYSDIGGLNKWVHIWAYRSLEERARVRQEAQARGIWPPPGGVAPVKQENKILLPASFSPLQ